MLKTSNEKKNMKKSKCEENPEPKREYERNKYVEKSKPKIEYEKTNLRKIPNQKIM